MSKKPDIQILVVNHKPSFSPDNPLLKPIQVGTELSQHKLKGMTYYDNEGENISRLNRSYCELTATYWAWKNVKADYYGLFHYRRYLSFTQDENSTNHPGRAYPSIQAAYGELGLDETQMRSIIEANDLVVPRKDNTMATTGESSLYDQYANEHYIADLDYCIDFIERNYKEILPYVNVLHGSEAYFCNMFIMKKDLFNEYCAFIFDVLENFEKDNSIEGYNVQQYRVTGFLAERLTNVFIHYLIGTGKYKVKELQIAYFENTDPVETVEPIQDNSINVVLAADNYYTPYVSTLLGSLSQHSNKSNMYDITVFHKDITSENQRLLKEGLKDYDNISLRFCNMSGRLSDFENLDTKWHITVETYFRLFIPEIMAGYQKVLYLDGDMIIKRDVAELFNEDVKDYMLAACRDVDMAGVYSSNLVNAENTINKNMRKHIDKEVGLTNPYDYFQAGVLLLNLDSMRKAFSTKELLDIAVSQKWEYLDQDILNHVANGKVKYLDQRWNVLYDWEFVRIKNVISKAPIYLYDEYMNARKEPFIVHYGGSIKPWQRADADMASEYWDVARKSVFYELILSRMMVWAVKNKDKAAHSENLRLRTKIVRKLRRGADVIAPMGSARRRPITMASRIAKKIVK